MSDVFSSERAVNAIRDNRLGVDVDQIVASATTVVTDLYRKLLQREPDPVGLRGYTARLLNRTCNIGDIAEEMLRSEEFLLKAPRLLYGGRALNPDRFTNDHSQFGELFLLIKLWVNAVARHRIVVDVGARGRDRSNSYDLLKNFGWKGVLIEANPALLPVIQREFSGLDMELLNFAVSDYDGRAEFHISRNEDVSSLNAAATLGWGAIAETIEVPVARLGVLLEERDVPHDFDLLSLDIEGEDIKVFNDLLAHSKFLPRWVIIEASYDFKTKSLDDLPFSEAVRSHYRIVGQTKANLLLQGA